MGSDTGNDVGPNPYERFTNPVHQVGIVSMGLWILDNAWLDDLAEACEQRGRWEFMMTGSRMRSGARCHSLRLVIPPSPRGPVLPSLLRRHL